MDKQSLQSMQQRLDELAQSVPEENIEFWFARDLQEPLAYARWENFLTAIQRAMTSCDTIGFEVADHFRDATKMISGI